jgi:hypothetical protein
MKIHKFNEHWLDEELGTKDKNIEYSKFALKHSIYVAIERAKTSINELSPDIISEVLHEIADSNVPKMPRSQIFKLIDDNWKIARNLR